MILLHQHIAYPPDELRDIVRLPSSCSAETCQLAAIETSSIAQKFLAHSVSDIVVAQFPFCVFIAARVLLGR
jgi:sulfite reductase beta subunit-like hemoprotein